MSNSITRLENPPQGIPRYSINNEGYYSVTQILDDGSFRDFDPKKILHALTLGSVVHNQIENFFKNQALDYKIDEILEKDQLLLYNFLSEGTPEEWMSYKNGIQDFDKTLEEIVLKNRINESYNQFKHFYEENDLKLIFAEEVIYNPDYLFAGTIDLVCELDGEITIIDHKTSRFVDSHSNSEDKYTAQLSAYMKAIQFLEEKEDLELNLNILHLNPLHSKYSLIKRNFNFDLFLNALSRFSQDLVGVDLPEASNKERELLFLNKEFRCPSKDCTQVSSFPFPKEQEFLDLNKVKRIIKVSKHETENHFAVYHLSVPHYKIEKSFVKDILK